MLTVRKHVVRHGCGCAPPVSSAQASAADAALALRLTSAASGRNSPFLCAPPASCRWSIARLRRALRNRTKWGVANVAHQVGGSPKSRYWILRVTHVRHSARGACGWQLRPSQITQSPGENILLPISPISPPAKVSQIVIERAAVKGGSTRTRVMRCPSVARQLQQLVYCLFHS